MDSGQLVPDEIVIEIVRERLECADAQKGYILDGFPRTVVQADALKKMLSTMKTGETGKGEEGQKLELALALDVPQADLVQRLLGRAKEQGRLDDTEDVIRARIQTYTEKTQPLLDYYRKEAILKEIDGRGKVEEIRQNIEGALESL